MIRNDFTSRSARSVLRVLPRVLLLLTGGLAASGAEGYTIESPVTSGCHERITAEALGRAGWPGGIRPPPLSREEAVLRENLPFAAGSVTDGWSLAALVGVRDNDLHGAAVSDLPEHAEVDLAEGSQREHCLRTAAQDGAEGDAAAAADCRAYILEEVRAALGEGESVDPAATEPVVVTLRYQQAQVPLSRYGYRLGRALHALQDSFTHAYRSEDFTRLRGVFNYVDPALATDYRLERDGPAHVSALDRCTGLDAAAERRIQATISASAALLSAVADGSGGREGRLARADAVLRGYLELESGCGPANGWCGASTASESPAPSGCAAGPGAVSAAGLLAGLGALRSKRRRR